MGVIDCHQNPKVGEGPQLYSESNEDLGKENCSCLVCQFDAQESELQVSHSNEEPILPTMITIYVNCGGLLSKRSPVLP